MPKGRLAGEDSLVAFPCPFLSHSKVTYLGVQTLQVSPLIHTLFSGILIAVELTGGSEDA